MTSWKRFDLKKVGDGWGGLVPCADVTSGTLRYYIQGLDDTKESVASNGDARHARTPSAIKDDLSGDAPHLPGMKPPKSCYESSDCPPDFPGVQQERRLRRRQRRRERRRGRRQGQGERRPSIATRSASWGRSTSSRWRRDSDLSASTRRARCPPTAPTSTAPTATGRTSPRNEQRAERAPPGPPGSPTAASSAANRGSTTRWTSRRAGGRPRWRVDVHLLRQAAHTDGRAWGASRLYADARFTYLFGENALARPSRPWSSERLGATSFDTHTDGITLSNGQSGTVSLWQTDGPFFFLVGGGIHVMMRPSFGGTLAVRREISFSRMASCRCSGPRQASSSAPDTLSKTRRRATKGKPPKRRVSTDKLKKLSGRPDSPREPHEDPGGRRRRRGPAARAGAPRSPFGARAPAPSKTPMLTNEEAPPGEGARDGGGRAARAEAEAGALRSGGP